MRHLGHGHRRVMPAKREAVWRDVAYIGMLTGYHGGVVWRLVLDGCGHTEHRRQRRPRTFAIAIEKLFAPKRVICTACMHGLPPFDVATAVKLAERIGEATGDPIHLCSLEEDV